MAAALNGMAEHGGVIPFGATFLMFSDYMRPSIRLAALSEPHVIYVFTHDSIALGEDGPTHQPVEQLATLRAIPPSSSAGDANETVDAWQVALETRGPWRWCYAPEAADARSLPRWRRRRAGQGAYILADPRRRSRRHPDRHRLRGLSRPRRARALDGGRDPRAAWCRCRAGSCSRRSRSRIGRRCCRPACGAGGIEAGPPSDGTATSAATARASASTASAPRRRGRGDARVRLHARARGRDGQDGAGAAASRSTHQVTTPPAARRPAPG